MTDTIATAGHDEDATATDEDGYIYRLSDGEVVGHSGVKPAWRAETADDAEWALGKRAEIEAQLAAVRLRKEALIANLTAIERRHEGRLRWWDWRLRPDVIAFARRSLEGGKARTARFAFGCVKFRQSAGTNRIMDMPAAVAFVESVRPEAVRVERSVTATAVLEVAAAAGESRPTLAHFLESSGPRETVTVETGVAG